MKEYADDNFKSDRKGREFSKQVENTLQAIFPFLTGFSKDLYCNP